jgi:transposase
MNPILVKVFPKRRKSHALRLGVNLGNYRIHSSNAAKRFVDGNSLVPVPHPPYSPDLVLSEFWLFGHIKTSLAGYVFNNADELLEAVFAFLNQIHPYELQLIFHHWIE